MKSGTVPNTTSPTRGTIQNWFIRKVFHLPKFSSHLLLLKISGLISVENEIAKCKLFFFARMALSTSDTVLCKLFQARVRSFLTIQNNSFGFIKDVVFFMHKYSLSDCFDNWTRNRLFPSHFDWKRIVKSRIAAHENNAWTEYASVHQDIEILHKTFSCVTNNEFWEIVDRIPDLAFKRTLQIRLMGNFGLRGSLGYGSLEVQRVYFVKTVTWKIFLIFCLLALNLKMNGLLFGIFSRKKFQIPITLKKYTPSFY